MKRKQLIALAVALTITLIACNRAFLPKKTRLLYQKEGYIIEQDNRVLFIQINPKQNWIDQINGVRAFKISSGYGYAATKHILSDSIEISMDYLDGESKQKVVMQERIYVTRVRISYSLPAHKRESKQDEVFQFDYQGKNYSIITYIPFNGYIYEINTLDSLGNVTGLAPDSY